MKLLISLLFIFSVSCMQQEQGPINQDNVNTIAYNSDEDGGNGGTGINAIDAKLIYQDFRKTILPNYMSHAVLTNKFDVYQVRVKMATPFNSRNFSGISYNTSDFTQMVQTTFTTQENWYVFTYEFKKAFTLRSFSIHTSIPIPQGAIEKIEVVAGMESPETLYYTANNLSDYRASFYNSNKVVSFNIVDEICAGITQTNFDGSCVQHLITCNDYEQLEDGKQFCKIKRDDNQEVFCYQTESLQQCKEHANQVCVQMPTLIQYHNQMFWGEVEGNIQQTIQCPLNL